MVMCGWQIKDLAQIATVLKNDRFMMRLPFRHIAVLKDVHLIRNIIQMVLVMVMLMVRVVAKILTANAIVIVVVVFLAQKQKEVAKLLVKQ